MQLEDVVKFVLEEAARQGATQAAAEAMVNQLKTFAASMIGENADACSLNNNATVCVGRRMSFAQLATSARSLGKVLSARDRKSVV